MFEGEDRKRLIDFGKKLRAVSRKSQTAGSIFDLLKIQTMTTNDQKMVDDGWCPRCGKKTLVECASNSGFRTDQCFLCNHVYVSQSNVNPDPLGK
jgi:hypothetical protein